MHDRATRRWHVGWSPTVNTALLDVGREPGTTPLDSDSVPCFNLSDIKRLLTKAAAEGTSQLLVEGMEPTLRRDLGAIIRGGSKRGLFMGVRTDGRRFSVPGYAEKMANSGLRYVEVVTSLGEATQDSREQERVFEQACAGLDALIAVGVEVAVHCRLSSMTRSLLDPLLAFASTRKELTVVFESETGEADQRPDDPVLLRAKSLGVRYRMTGPVKRDIGHASSELGLEQRPIQSFRGVPIFSPMVDQRLPEMGRLDTSPRYPDTALITLIVGGCDLNCIFCETPQAGTPPEISSLSSVTTALETMRKTTSGVYFTGGEPSSVPWIFDAIGHAKALGYDRIQMQSHAGHASDPAYARRLVDAGLTAIDIPFYGPSASVHEHITKTAHSFERTKRGLENLRALGVHICVHATLFQANLDSVRGLIQMWNTVKPRAAYLQTSGEVGQPGTYARVAPAPRAVGATIQDALQHVKPDFPLYVTDVAACHMPAEKHRILRWKTPLELRSECLVLPYSDWLMTFTRGRARTKGQACFECREGPACDGIAHEALELFGEQELIPQ